jgi:group I intron endonuclease
MKKILSKGSSAIYSAIIKYGHSNFSLDILEYCVPNVLISKEQYYIDKLKPEYNILRTAGSSLGFKHSDTTKVKMSINNTGENNPRFGKKLSNDTKYKIKISTSGIRHYLFGKHHTYETRRKIAKSHKLSNKPYIMPKMRLETKLKLSLSSIGLKVKVFDKSNNLIHDFSSIRKAAKYFNVNSSTISRVLNKDMS